MLDLTPQGRGDWYAKLEYSKPARTSSSWLKRYARIAILRT